MRSVIGRIVREVKIKPIIISNNKRKGRVIDQLVYERLKAKRICDYCGKPCGVPEIHHKIAISQGGSNKEENLMAVHKKCHEKLDIAQGTRTKEQIKNGRKPKFKKPKPRKK